MLLHQKISLEANALLLSLGQQEQHRLVRVVKDVGLLGVVDSSFTRRHLVRIKVRWVKKGGEG